MGFAAAILAMVLLFAGCGQTETKTESSTAASETEDETLVHVLALKGPTSMGMVKMMSDNDSKESAADTFELAAAPDEVSAKLVQGEVDIAAVPANLASVLYNKTNGGVQVLAVNTLGVLYIVEDGDTVHSIADLKGKKVAVGAAGSGAEANARQILAAYGITYDDIDERFLSCGEAADALKDGNVDAGVVVAGFPTAAIQDLAANKSAAIINIDSDKADELMKKYPYYTKVSIPKGTYPGQEEDIHSVAVKCVVVTTDKMDDKLGGEVVKAIYEHLDRMKAAHAVGKYITKDTALDGMSIPMNAGAEQYLKAK